MKYIVLIPPPPPNFVYQGRHYRHSREDLTFPLQFCKLQAIKKWTVGRTGDKAKLVLFISVIKYHVEHNYYSSRVYMNLD